MHCVARSFRQTVFACGLILISQEARPEALNAGLRQRIETTSAEVKRLETERAESAALLGRGEALLAQAQGDGDQASIPVIEKAIAKARNAIAACDAGITAAKGRVESLTGALKTMQDMSASSEPVIPASVVDLRDVKDFKIDPAKVSGYAGGMHGRLTAEKATAVHQEIRTRAQGRASGSNLATMSYAELMASLDGEARQGLKEGMQRREREVDQKLRRAFQLPDDSDEDLLDLILPPEPAKPSPLQQAMQGIQAQALRLMHAFDRVQHDEKERVFETYQAWKAGTEKLMSQMDGKQLSAREYQEASKLLDARFLFTLTLIGKAAETKEDEKITAELPGGDHARKGGAK